jgi:hypothetical protein
LQASGIITSHAGWLGTVHLTAKLTGIAMDIGGGRWMVLDDAMLANIRA